MVKQIEVENQIIEFPDEMPDNEIESVIKREFYNKQIQQKSKPYSMGADYNKQTQQKSKPYGMGAELLKKASEYIPQEGRIGSALTIATNFPLAPRPKALTAALTAKAMGGDESIGQFYDEALKNELEKLKTARTQYPKQSFITQLASDIAILRGRGLLNKLGGATVKKALVGGAILGATTAAGETQDLTKEQAISDIAGGGFYGGVGGVVGQQVGKKIGQSVPFIKEAGKKIVKYTPFIKNKETSESILSKILTPEEAGIQASKLATKVKQGRITTLPELENEKVLGLTRLLGKTQGSNKIINDYINKKTVSSAKRVGDIVNKNISAEGYFDTLDNTIAKRKELATPLYKKAYEESNKALLMPTTGIERLGTIRELINDDRIKNAIKKARKDYGINQEIPDIAIETLHGTRQVVDDIIGSAKKAGENNKARSYMDLKNKINNVIYNVAPTMKEADKTFAGFSALKNAQEEGLKFNQYRNGEEVKRAFAKLSDGEKETFKIGVKDYLLDKVAKSSDRNPAKAIYGNQLERRKLQALFDNPKQYNDFAKRLNDEIRVFNVKQRIVGGSRTDINLQEQTELLDKIAKGAVSFKTFGVSDILLLAKDLIKKRYYGLNEKISTDLAKIIIDPEQSIKMLNNIAKKAQTPQEKILIQKFTEDLSKKNFTGPLAIQTGRAMVNQQSNEEE